MSTEKLGLLLDEAAEIFEEDFQSKALVEEARAEARAVLECDLLEASIAIIVPLLLRFIPLLADLISNALKLLRSDPKAAIVVLSKALPFLDRLLVQLDRTAGEEFRFRAPKIIFDRGIFHAAYLFCLQQHDFVQNIAYYWTGLSSSSFMCMLYFHTVRDQQFLDL